jgi:hypothetical protein
MRFGSLDSGREIREGRCEHGNAGSVGAPALQGHRFHGKRLILHGGADLGGEFADGRGNPQPRDLNVCHRR